MALALEDTPAVQTAAPARPRRTAPARPARRLGGRAHKAVLAAHVLTSVGWFGLAATVAFIGVAGGSADDIAYTEVMRSTLSLSIPLGLAAAATGIVLSLTTRWGLARYWWVVIKEAITLAAIVTDVLVVGPELTTAIDAGRPGELPGPVVAHVVVLAIATVLSVVKPKARVRAWSA
jgi:hypothetical protein